MLEQIIIAISGVSAIWLSQDADQNHRKYAPIIGLIGQPFWFYSSYMSEQWGIFVLSFFFTAAWYRGYRTYWRNT